MTTCWKPKPDLYTHFLKVSRSLPSFMWRKYIESSKEFPTLLMNQKVSPMHHLCCPPWVVSPPIDQHLSTELLGNSKVCWQVCLVEPMAKDHSMPWHWHHTSANQQTPQTNKLHRKQCCFFLGGLDACYGWKKNCRSTSVDLLVLCWGSKLKPVRSPTHWV